MRKINISLVGGQLMPVYVGIKQSEPDSVVLVHSAQTQPEAESVKEKCGIEDVRLETFPTEDFSLILKKAIMLLDELAGNEVTANITGGLKPWSIAFTMAANGRENLSVVYIDQNNRCYDLLKGEDQTIELPLDITTILEFQNQNVPSRTLLADYTEADRNVLKSLKKFRSYNFNDFRLLTSPLDKQQAQEITNRSKGTIRLNTGSSVTFDREGHHIVLTLVTRNGNTVTKGYTSPHVFDIVFFTGWFEYEVALLLSQCKRVKEVWLNVRFPYRSGSDKNEIDIIASLGTKLLFVECKTQIFNKTDLDKFNSAVKNYGGGSSMSLFVTEAKMNNETKEKCKDNKILHMSLEEIVPFGKKKELGFNTERIWALQLKYLDKLIEDNFLINKK